MGKQEMWLGDTAVPFCLWARERRICKEQLILVECTELLDEGQLAKVFPAYDVTTFIQSPSFLACLPRESGSTACYFAPESLLGAQITQSSISRTSFMKILV